MNEKLELAIQRLVDNELDARQRAEFLQLADTQPELWRQATLAFVEDRVWSSVVGNRAGQAEVAISGAGTEPRKIDRRPWWIQFGPQLLMTAAMVLFVFTIALRFNPVNPTPLPAVAGSDSMMPAPGDHPSTPESSGSTAAPGNLAVNQEPYQLRMDDNLHVPLFEDFSRMRQEIDRLELVLDPATQRRFMEGGFEVQPEIHYITGNSLDGRSFIVPVQSFRVKRFMQ